MSIKNVEVHANGIDNETAKAHSERCLKKIQELYADISERINAQNGVLHINVQDGKSCTWGVTGVSKKLQDEIDALNKNGWL